MSDYRTVIELWPRPCMPTLARDLGVNYDMVYKWHTRNSIPARMWPQILEAAKKRKIKINANTLVGLKNGTAPT